MLLTLKKIKKRIKITATIYNNKTNKSINMLKSRNRQRCYHAITLKDQQVGPTIFVPLLP